MGIINLRITGNGPTLVSDPNGKGDTLNTLTVDFTAIGIAVAGTTNSASKQTVTVLESAESRQGGKNDSVQDGFEPTASFGLDSDLVWTSWLDDGLWDIDFNRSLEHI